MAKRRRMGRSRPEGKAPKVRCPKCNEEVAENELDGHLRGSHGFLSVILSQKRRDLAILSAVVAIVVVFALLVYMSPTTEETRPPPSTNWLDDYQPEHAIGSGRNDWWVVYPEVNPNPGQTVTHPTWVMDALQDGPLIILDHSEGCAPCVQQTADFKAVLKDYHGQITYIDLLADGNDQRAYDAFDAYDANGDPPYIPLTIVVTQVNEGDGTKIIWQSTEGATGQDWLHGYVQDAIYYYEKN